MWKWISLPAIALVMTLAAPTVASASPGYATGNVNMRSGPSTRYHRIVTVPRGASVEIYGCSAGWCDTYYAGRRGWVSGRYLSAGGYRPRAVSPGAAAAGIVGLGIAGAIIADSVDDRRHYRYRTYHPRPHYRYRTYYPRRHYRYRHYPRRHVYRPAPRRYYSFEYRWGY